MFLGFKLTFLGSFGAGVLMSYGVLQYVGEGKAGGTSEIMKEIFGSFDSTI